MKAIGLLSSIFLALFCMAGTMEAQENGILLSEKQRQVAAISFLHNARRPRETENSPVRRIGCRADGERDEGNTRATLCLLWFSAQYERARHIDVRIGRT